MRKLNKIFFVLAFWITCFSAGYFIPYLFPNSIQGAEPETNSSQVLSSDTNKPQPNPNLLERKNNNIIRYFSSCSYEVPGIKTINNPSEITALVDKSHKIPEDYRPIDLVVLYKEKYPVKHNLYLRNEPAVALLAMMEELRNQGLSFLIVSGWRTQANQVAAFQLWVGIVGKDKAKDYAALPGHSEHQLGLAIDIARSESGYANGENFGNTDTGIWLAANSYKFGYVLSYPKNQKETTGYNYEPWHFRYIGINAAKEINKQNITLAEYLYQVNGICR